MTLLSLKGCRGLPNWLVSTSQERVCVNITRARQTERRKQLNLWESGVVKGLFEQYQPYPPMFWFLFLSSWHVLHANFFEKNQKNPTNSEKWLYTPCLKAWVSLVRAGSIPSGKGNQMNTLRNYLWQVASSMNSLVNRVSVTRPKSFCKQEIRALAHTRALSSAYLLFTRWRLMNGCKKAGLAILHCGHTREYVMGLFFEDTREDDKENQSRAERETRRWRCKSGARRAGGLLRHLYLRDFRDLSVVPRLRNETESIALECVQVSKARKGQDWGRGKEVTESMHGGVCACKGQRALNLLLVRGENGDARSTGTWGAKAARKKRKLHETKGNARS